MLSQKHICNESFTFQTEKSLWNMVFMTASVLFITTGVFYNVFASGEVQAWNYPKKINVKLEEKEPMYSNGNCDV